jgi:hypothetical protein
MRLLSALTVVLAVLAAPVLARADDAAKEKELTGAFKRKAGELDLKMIFQKDGVLVYEVTIGDGGCVMESKYKKEKDGTYKCEVTKYEKKGDFPVTKEKGYEFSFKFEVKDGKAKLSDFMGADVDDNAKMAIEGEYEKATD